MARDRKPSADEAGVGPDPRQTRHLTPLAELPRFRIKKGEPDIRGWSVYTSNGREVGSVDDLLVDTSIGEAVMLEIDLKDVDRRTAAPMRAAWIDRAHRRVILDSAFLTPDTELPGLGRTPPAEELRQTADRYAVAPEPPARLITPPPGGEVVVERRVVAADEPAGARGLEGVPPSGEMRAPSPGQTLIEEVVVRRRYVDAEELAALERSSGTVPQPPPEPPVR